MTQASAIRSFFSRHAGLVLTVPELAELMSMSPNTLLNYIHDGRLAALKLERGYRILTEDAIAFFESAYTAQGAPAGDAPEPAEGAIDESADELPPVRHLRPSRPSPDSP